MRTWAAYAGLSAATAVLAGGAAAALWGVPDWALLPMQRALAPGARDDRHGGEARIVALEAENAMLRARLDQYAAIAGEGGFPPERVVLARGRVVARTLRSGRRYSELDVGSAAGVLRDLPVAAGWSLVGMVAGVREGRCLVQEIADAESRLPAMVIDGGTVVAEGVLAGTGDPAAARLDFIEPREGLRIDPGMAVATAGSDGRLPPGMSIGRVVSASRGESPAEPWRIRVQLAAVGATGESLLVLRSPGPPRPAVPPPPAAAGAGPRP